jgi:D-alanyl-D-alanine carboxypeptidase (penicillin-binding protein 5/6)
MVKAPRALVAFAALLLIAPVASSQPGEHSAPAIAPPDGIAAKAWAIVDGKTGKLLWGFHETEARPIASTTKIMSAWIIFQHAEKNPRMLDEEIRFSERAAATRGSSCRLKAGERLPVRELLYGLLLPSGNDAAVALAEHFGPRLQDGEANKGDAVALFVAEMNHQAKNLKLDTARFLDPNGLARNEASARDLAVLTWHAMQNRRFRDYVKTREHECDVVTGTDTKRRVVWKNTNRMLEDKSCDGVKTGTTTAAGACLVSSVHQGDDHLIVVVLGSTSGNGRYDDTRKLLHWAWKQRGDNGPR